jgi:abortive infection bacteriophage resistance protein
MIEPNITQKYSKKPLSLDEQVTLLKERGLIIDNEEKLKYYLKNISYYHLSIYFKYFQRNDVFIKETNFNDVLDIYVFDNKLRVILFEILERIEKSFKCRVAHEIAIKGGDSHWYIDKQYFDNEAEHQKILDLITEKVEKSGELSIEHYKQTYTDPVLPPIWTVLEILSFGECIHVYKKLKKEYRNIISKSFGENEKFVANWMLCASLLRNHCAHYSRLWKRYFTYAPQINHRKYGKYFNGTDKDLYNYLVVLQILLRGINPTASWLEKFVEITKDCKINLKNLNFPDNWKESLEEIITIK